MARIKLNLSTKTRLPRIVGIVFICMATAYSTRRSRPVKNAVLENVEIRSIDACIRNFLLLRKFYGCIFTRSDYTICAHQLFSSLYQ